MPEKGPHMFNRKIDFVWIGAVFGLFYWIFQAFRDSYILNRGPFLDNLFFPDIMSFAMRMIVVILFLLFAIHTKYLQERFQQQREGQTAFINILALVLSAVAFAMLYWILDAFQDIIIEAKGNLFERIVTPGLTQLITRFLSGFTLIALVFISQYIMHTRKKADKAVREAREHLVRTKENLQKIVYHIEDGIAVTDQNGILLFVNPSAERMLGKPISALIGTPLNYVLTPDNIQELRIVSDKEIVIAECRSTEIVWENNPAVLISMHDITEKKQMEKIRSNFLSLISVNLRTPVAGIMGSLENMLEGLVGQLSERQREYLQVMYTSIRGKYQLINGMLAVLRLESGGEKAHPEPLELKSCLHAVADPFISRLKEKPVSLSIRGVEEGLIVMADPDKFAKAIEAVLHNAVKYTDAGRITLDVLSPTETVDIIVTDTGKGMDETTLRSLFSREQLMESFPTARSGLGFGLYMAKRYMQLQNGDISVLSTVGKGSQFKITLPVYHDES